MESQQCLRIYSPLRDAHAGVRARHGHLSGDRLTDALLNYSVRGQYYVKTLRWLIQHYKLDELNDMTFMENGTADLVSFPQVTPPKK